MHTDRYQISVDVNSPVSGVVTSLAAQDGDTVYVGDELFVIDTEGDVCSVKSGSSSDDTVSDETAEEEHCSGSDRRETRVPMSRMRQKIAERLKGAQDAGVLLTTFQECDMSALMDLRKKVGPAVLEKFGTKLGFMSFFMAACSKSLAKFPSVNGSEHTSKNT